MANEVKLTIKIDDKGSLSVVAKNAEKAAKATDKVSKATDKASASKNRYNKLEKGTAGLGANTTKGFAKQAQIVGNGLVPAYATLAANVFAISAAFNALKSAESATLLQEGLDRTGDAAGRNLPYLADRLKEITGAAISTKDAMEQVALGTASGFSQAQMESLTKVASGASKALGRDMTDALSRLTRGAAKLEPEILDELGIMVRLDDATTTYAASLGKTADELSIVERRMAFTNAIIEQGIQKYGDLADAVDPSAYDQLAASFDSLSKGFLNIINVGLTPFLNLLSGNSGALVGATALFGSTVTRQMVPALYEGASAAAESAEALADQATAAQGSIKTTGNLPEVYKGLSKSIQEGTASQEEYDQALGSLDKSLTSHHGQMKGMLQDHDEESEKIQTKRGKIAEVNNARKDLLGTMKLQRLSSSKTAAANAIESASNFQLKASIDFIKISYAEKMAAEKLSALSTGTTVGVLAKLRAGFFAAGVSAKAFGAALLSAIPIIGQIIFIGSLLIDFIIQWVMETNATETAAQSAADSLNNFADAYTDLQDRLAKDNAEPVLETAQTMAGVFSEISSRFKEITDSMATANAERLKEINADLTELKARTEGTIDRPWYDIFTDGDAWKGARTLQSSMDALITERDELLSKKVDGTQVIDLASTQLLLDSAITNLEVFGVKTVGARSVLQSLKDSLTEDTPVSAVQSVIAALGQQDQALVASLENVRGSFSKVQEEVAKFSSKNVTPFDDLLTQVVGINKSLEGVSDEAAAAIIRSMPESFKKMMGESEASVSAFTERLKENVQVLVEMPGKIAEKEASLKKLKLAAKSSGAALEKALNLEETIKTDKISVLTREQDIIRQTTKQTDEQLANNQRFAELSTKIAAIEATRVSEAVRGAQVNIQFLKDRQKVLQVDQKILAANKSLFDAQARSRRIEAELQNMASDPTSNNTGVTALQERDLYEQELEKRTNLAIREDELRRSAIGMEYDLLGAQASLLRARLVDAKENTKAIDDYIGKLDGARTAALDAQDGIFKTTMAEIGLQSKLNQSAVEQAALTSASDGGSTSERLSNFSKAGGFGQFDSLNEKVRAARDAMQPMIEDAKKLGPEGELVAAIAQGSFAIADSMTAAFESGATGMEKAAGIAQAVGDSIGAVNSIMQASISASIAKLDEQIAAEKKRDGKSAQSVAKIQAMEKKQEGLKRKAFETNKKMLMAQTVANTAAGIMSAIATKGVAGIVIGSIIAAMGAAQLAIISGTSYQGGSGSSGANVPKSISVGKRDSSVDLAKSSGGAGELGYLRGESGTGGPENFKRGFAGVRYRAEGGNAGIVVGEQGPELFVPETPGRVVANDDVGGGGMQNVNFSINAVDAAGVEDLLVNQRGNIIGMLREASNSYGQPFMEKVNTQVYSGGGQGISRYGAG